MENYKAVSALGLDPWRPGFDRVIFRRHDGDELAIELPCNMYRAVCGGPSCGGKTLADFARLFCTGLVRRAPTGFADYYTRGRIVLGEAYGGQPLDWEVDEWAAQQPA
jgi:hypothetical protein